MLYEMNNPACSELIDKLKKYPLVKINNHNIKSKDQLIKFGRELGPLLKWPFGYVNELKVSRSAKNYLYTNESVPYHWDGAFHESPYLLIFHCLKAPLKHAGGETLFSNSNQLIEKIDTKTKKLLRQATLCYRTEKVAHYGGQIKITPFQSHPFTDQPVLRYAEPVYSKYNPVELSIEGVNAVEQDYIISIMQQHLYDESVYYQHRWQDNELIIADNHLLLHGRKPFNSNSDRHINRVQVKSVDRSIS